ncbi:hypothetical protein B0O99DRAFT_610699 [Bisporella sp. PMI_857]|nr:hypothetical protein B0O99DRAFT_612508 [Bisporella sp. PMI_857]KAH8600440.1 hypothetical protein B0O99DRAFT_610699 [Bisporella sp. PMI_857]
MFDKTPSVVEPQRDTNASSSFFGSLRRKASNLSTKSNKSSHSQDGNAPRQRSVSPNPSMNPFSRSYSPSTRQESNMNSHTLFPNEPAPPSYGESLNAPLSMPQPHLPAQQSPLNASTADDPYAFLKSFDTVLLIDDSGSMRDPIVAAHDSDGMDIYFLNHKTTGSAPKRGVADTGYYGIKDAHTVAEIFSAASPQRATPTGARLNHILKPYFDQLERRPYDTKPLNLIIFTDGESSDDPEGYILKYLKKLEKLDAEPNQLGIQFFQVGNDAGATAALKDLDDNLPGDRDIVDTVKWTGRPLTADLILKSLLGAVVRRLDRKQ